MTNEHFISSGFSCHLPHQEHHKVLSVGMTDKQKEQALDLDELSMVQMSERSSTVGKSLLKVKFFIRYV